MKRLLLLFICSIMISYVFAQKAILQTDAKKMNLKGKVKSIREIEYNASGQKDQAVKAGIKEYGKNFFYEFDEPGNNVLKTEYNSDGSKYNYTKYKYSKPGLTSEELSYDKNDVLLSKILREYNEFNLSSKTTEYNGSGNITSQYIYKYDFKDLFNYVSVSTDLSGVTYPDTVSKSKDNLLLFDITSGKGWYSKTSNRYNADKQKIHVAVELSPGHLSHEFFYEYDKQGNVIKEDYKKPVIKITSKTINIYTYDLKNNWIKKISKRDGDDPAITERIIVYY